ncbi:MAG: aldehyde dehydrogenase [Akkermansia sp.]|nr:aldehyde dehydrogenase [Akkermansia sp.]
MREIVETQRQFFHTHVTRDVAFRIRALKKLQQTIREWEPRISEALHADLGKSATEGYMCEIGLVLGSLRDTLKNIRKWSRARRVSASLAHFPSSCRVEADPYGVVLIMSPWNYPVLLCLDPLIAALSAGNCCVVKPSSTTPATSAVLAEMLGSIFPPEYVKVVLGGRENCNALLEEKFDYIFFTGSPNVGHTIMEAAARHLTPVTLELGGKSPCIVDKDCNVKVAARRIAFGKILNAGQTCVAPDYLLIHASRKQEFVTEFREAVAEMLGEHPVQNENLTHIITPRHFERIMGLMNEATPVVGGQGNAATLRIEPTLLDNVTPDSASMQEEIFGPLLPMLSWNKWEDVEGFVLSRPRPLASYLFTTNRETEQNFRQHLAFGGGCVNDTIIHLAVHGMPFGGVGNSGMGAYHGKTGFDTFTHYKSILKKGNWLDLPFRYQPYNKLKSCLLRLFLR